MNTSQNDISYEADNTLDKNTFLTTLEYADMKQDSRIDSLHKSIDTIKFWVTIIGLYYLIKILIIIFSLITIAEGSKELLQFI